ncbi:hypothetical protein MUN77_15515 [Leucobacter allii]|uniref:hypothetical protein n=1 Tax=Leucobacter allii TaxID=2932247 RepID=UPI001FD08005|nr:hypothetical protein [Leucobacter allii]UOR01514.1 hypothetical protein MUN77_15515 [Leucobacter allii]
MHLVVSVTGKALLQASGLSGGYLAATQRDLLMRGTGVRERFAAGSIPRNSEDIGGAEELMPVHQETDRGDCDVYFTHWRDGGGSGDPLPRDPERVAEGVATEADSAGAAESVYGIVLDGTGGPDLPATEKRRAALRRERAGIAG